MYIRKYEPSDCGALSKLFYDTVHSVNQADYTPRQLHAWASGRIDEAQWNRSFLEHFTVVAVEEGVIAGFGDIDRTGYLDRLYVHKDYQRMGIASGICNVLEKSVCSDIIWTRSSVTARPFFIKRGYQVIGKLQVLRNGILLAAYQMGKHTGGVPAGKDSYSFAGSGSENGNGGADQI